MISLIGLLLLPLLVQAKLPFEADIQAYSGKVCALGDFDGDRNTDILVIREDDKGKYLQVLTQGEQGAFSNSTKIEFSGAKFESIKCAVGDFNEDHVLDVLVDLVKKDGTHRINVYLMNKERTGFKALYVDEIGSEPMAADINGDGITDVIGFYKNGTLFCRLGQKGVEPTLLESCHHHFMEKHRDGLLVFPEMPHLFVDIDGDLSAELIFLREKDGALILQTWKRDEDARSGQEHSRWIHDDDMLPPIPADFKNLGAPLIADFDGDARLEIALPVCKDADCTTVTSFLLYETSREIGDFKWNPYSLDMPDLLLVRDPDSKVLFRVGDFNLDGFPDLVATFVSTKNEHKAFTKIIDNEECKECGAMTRRFNIRRNSHLVEPCEAALGNATLSAFFDLKEDGNLDILLEYNFHNNERKFSFIASDEKGDTTFLKIQTYTNGCQDRCRVGTKDIGSGIAWGGVCVSFEMTDSWLGTKQSVACQLPSSGVRTLHTPYVLFGLGRSPNFVDRMQVGSPRVSSISNKGNQLGVFKQIVPNSRVIVIPPLSDGVFWQSRLYLTPSQLIIQSLIVLASVCCLLLLVVIVLHVRERTEDRVERQAQSHRFHFDAM